MSIYTQTHLEWLAENALILQRTPDCMPWCILHCQVDEETRFCMGPDILTKGTSNGYVGITHVKGEGVHIDLGHGIDAVTVEVAEELARAIMQQVARARGQEAGQ